MVLEKNKTKEDVCACILHRKGGKCWNWRTSRYVPIGTWRKRKLSYVPLRERGKCWKWRSLRNEYMCLLGEEEEKRKEKDFENII